MGENLTTFSVTEHRSHALASRIKLNHVEQLKVTSLALLSHCDDKDIVVLIISPQVRTSKEPSTVYKCQLVRRRRIVYDILVEVE